MTQTHTEHKIPCGNPREKKTHSWRWSHQTLGENIIYIVFQVIVLLRLCGVCLSTAVRAEATHPKRPPTPSLERRPAERRGIVPVRIELIERSPSPHTFASVGVKLSPQLQRACFSSPLRQSHISSDVVKESTTTPLLGGDCATASLVEAGKRRATKPHS